MKKFTTAVCLICCFSLPLTGVALDSDKDAPIAIQADTTDIDFRSGTRTLTGNVVIDQGSMHIEADKVIINYAGDQIDTATAWGKPVKFRQIPEGKDEEVKGQGLTLKMEQQKNLVTIRDQARLTQGTNTITGQVIYYNTLTSKMTVKGKTRSQLEKTAAQGKVKGVDATTSSSGRTRVIIQPGALQKPQ
jgi:lipopolysaccharide export system protein LptA